jgi:hypothetical protein
MAQATRHAACASAHPCRRVDVAGRLQAPAAHNPDDAALEALDVRARADAEAPQAIHRVADPLAGPVERDFAAAVDAFDRRAGDLDLHERR